MRLLAAERPGRPAGAGDDTFIPQIDFFAGTTLLATRTAAPYTTVWRNPLPGSYALTARATDNRGATTTSTAASITVGGTAVRITAPADGSALAAPAEITLQISAVTASGNSLTKLEIFDGASLLRTFAVSGNSVNINYGLLDVEAGSHVYTVKATLNTGAVVTSAPVTVNVLTAAAVTLTTLSNFYLAPAAIDLYANVTPAANTTIAKVEFFNSSSLIATLTASPYNFRWGNVVAGSYVVTARVTDSRGLVVTSAPLTVTVGSGVTIQVAAGLNGSTVNEDAITVSGTVSAPPNSAVNVNGQLATLTSGGQFFLNDLNLQAGTNTVTATVTAPDGQTANQVITVTRSAVATTFTVSVTSSGLAAPGSPFNADVTIENPSNTPFAIATVQCEDPGAGLDITQLGTLTCTYAVPGIYDVRVTVRDSLGGVIYAVVKRVTVVMPQALYNSIVSIYNGVTDRLKAGNIDGALNAFTRSVREKYRIAFTEVGTNLPAIVNGFGVMSGASINANFAELIIVKTTAQGDVATPVILGLGADGIWRIDGF